MFTTRPRLSDIHVNPHGSSAQAIVADKLRLAGASGQPFASAHTRLAKLTADLARREDDIREAAVTAVRATLKAAGVEASAEQIAKAAEPKVRADMLAVRRAALAEVEGIKADVLAAVPKPAGAPGKPDAPEHEQLVLQRFASLSREARRAAIADCIAGADDATAAALVRFPALAGIHLQTAETIRTSRFAANAAPAPSEALQSLARLTAASVAAIESELTTATAED